MNQILRWGGTTLGAAALGASALLVSLSGPANAEPSGCTSSVKGSTTSDGHLVAAAKGSCSTASTRNLRATVRQDISFYPDRVVGQKDTGNHAYKSYAVTDSECDDGRTETYFGVGYFTTNTTEHGTPHTKQHSCPR